MRAALCETFDYEWGGPGGNTENGGVGSNTDVCLIDQASCGCCLMQQQIYRMKTFFNVSFNELEKELMKTKNILNSVRASRSAFSVSLTKEDSLTCFGPFRGEDRLIVYKHVFINLGDGYNVNTGVFTVPRSGVYSFALTIYSDAGSPANSLAACAALLVNSQVVAGPSEKNTEDQEDSATVVIASHLKAGDKVSISLPAGCFLCDDSNHYNTFTGFLLFATD
ncbi:complement C1q-like protein 3 [Melanotaenia boesemani]|uniref:complement C1q-like protein 3 n=1 Tax=Melanotaenia boesemani TaxID=1250792 RepID=UPI001C049993|nr:complement C1q-like protein 3 [Melanotaenia boesemani]